MIQKNWDAGQPRLLGGNDHLGGTRMSPDPATGVVDTDAKIHGSANLFVAGNSVPHGRLGEPDPDRGGPQPAPGRLQVTLTHLPAMALQAR